MDKPELITEISKITGYTKGDTAYFIDGFIEAIYSALQRGEVVNLKNVGSWFAVERDARVGVNPGTREEVEIPQHSLVRFKISKNLRDSLKK